MLRRPMPSPKGTNVERLYVKTASVVAAYDSAEGLEPEAMERLRTFLKGKINEEDLQRAIAIMGGENEVSEAPPRDAQAQDGRKPSFASRFPSASRIGYLG